MLKVLKSIGNYRGFINNANRLRSIHNRMNSGQVPLAAQDLRKITDSVNNNFERSCYQEMYNKIEQEIQRLKANQELTEAAQAGYTGLEIFNSSDVRGLLPLSKRYEVNTYEYIRKFIAQYPELQGFKLGAAEDKMRSKLAITIKW